MPNDSGSGNADPNDLGSGNPDLDRLVARLWLEQSSASALVVTTGRLPDTHVVAEEYVVLPDVRRARFLVPVGAPAAVRSAFTSHLSTVSRKSRVIGQLIGQGFRSGAAERVLRDRLVVGIDRCVPRDRWREHLVLSELAALLGHDDLVAVHPVRRFTPNAKPTVRLFDRGGVARGYGKLGWSAPTRALVRNETAALEALDGGVAGLTVPRALLSGTFDRAGSPELEYLVTTALPPGLRPWTQPPENDAELLLRIAESGAVGTSTLGSSPYLDRLRRRIEAAQTACPSEADALAGWLARLELDQQQLRFGRWHGDWVAWNLALTGRGVAAWDWEYSAPDAPVGFDLLHWHFQHRLAAPGGDLDTAAAELAARLPGLGRLAVPEEARELVGALYLVEMLTRAAGLAAEGSGWNPKLHPRLITIARERAAASASR